MKKLLSLIIISLFMCGLTLADSNYTYENVTILGPAMGGAGKTPPIEIIRVTVGSEDDAVTAGTVMTWGIQPQYTDGNALGLVVEICNRSASEDISLTAGKGPYAGVMVTAATSNDQGAGGGWTNANPLRPSTSLGFMAIRGYVDANVSDGAAIVGGHLLILGNSATAQEGIEGYFGTLEQIQVDTLSKDLGLSEDLEDIGFLLEDTDTDGLMKVWLR